MMLLQKSSVNQICKYYVVIITALTLVLIGKYYDILMDIKHKHATIEILDDSSLWPILKPNCTFDNSSRAYLLKVEVLLSDIEIQKRLLDCDDYFKRIPVEAIRHQEGNNELKFAFSHLVHNDVAILEMFLAVMFRPGNTHCIHVDQKADPIIHQTVEFLTKCYNHKFGENAIFTIRHPIAVYWGSSSILQADLICMKELQLRNSNSWQYYVSTAGTELPLYTYPKLLQAGLPDCLVNSMKDGIIMQSIKWPSITDERSDYYFQMTRTGPKQYDLSYEKTLIKKPPPPFNLTIFLGLRNIMVSRNFSDFLINHPLSIQLYDWFEDTLLPEESFYQTLARVKKIGPDFVIQDLDTERPNLLRYTNWEYEGKQLCHGASIRSICNFAIQDLPNLQTQKEMFANKFNLAVDPLAAVCQWKYLRDMGANN